MARVGVGRMMGAMDENAAVRARVDAGDVPRVGGGTVVDMAALHRAYTGTWVGPLIRAVYDTGHDDGESCREVDIAHAADVDPANVVQLIRVARAALVAEGRCPGCGSGG